MENKFKLQFNRFEGYDLLEIGFIEGVSLTNAEYLKYLNKTLPELAINTGMGGDLLLLKINGPCSMPIAFYIASKLKPLYNAIAVFDPKEQTFVVSVFNGGLSIGTLID